MHYLCACAAWFLSLLKFQSQIRAAVCFCCRIKEQIYVVLLGVCRHVDTVAVPWVCLSHTGGIIIRVWNIREYKWCSCYCTNIFHIEWFMLRQTTQRTSMSQWGFNLTFIMVVEEHHVLDLMREIVPADCDFSSGKTIISFIIFR